MSDLRPIGTEFEYFFPPSKTSSNPDGHWARYRIVDHSMTSGGPAETVVCVGWRARKVAYYRLPDLVPAYEDEAE